MAEIHTLISKTEQDRIKELDVDLNDYRLKRSDLDQFSRLTGEEKIAYARKLKAKYGADIAISMPGLEL